MAPRPPNGFDGATIRRLRAERRWTQKRLVQEIRAAAADLGEHDPGVNIQMISRWENGKIAVGHTYVRLIEHAFSRTLDTYDDDDDALAEVNRRAFLLGTTAAVSLAVVNRLGNEPWQRLASTVLGRPRIDETTVDSLQALNVNLAEMFQPVPPRLLLGPVRSHLETLTGLLTDQALTLGLRQRLTSLAAEMSILIGWLSKESGDYATAQQCFTSALTAAVEAGDHDLGAYAVASASTLPAFRSSPEQSLGLLRSAEIRGAKLDHANTATRIWNACLRAEVHTRTGHELDAFDALDEADQLLERLDPDDGRRPILGHFDHASLMGERGVTAVRLRRSNEAKPALDEALAALADFPKTQSRILTSIARVQLQQRDIDEAVAAALRSLDVAHQTGSGVGVDDVRKFRSELQPWANTEAVRHLDQLLAVEV